MRLTLLEEVSQAEKRFAQLLLCISLFERLDDPTFRLLCKSSEQGRGLDSLRLTTMVG